MGGGGDGVALREDSPIDASTHLDDNGRVKERVKVGSVVGWRQCCSSVATTRQVTNRVGRRKVIVVERYVVVFVFVG